MSKARANNITPASAESLKPGEVCLFLPAGVTELISGHDESKHVRQSTSVQATPPLGLVWPAETGRTNASINSNIPQSLFIFLHSFQKDLAARIQLADVIYELRQPTRLLAIAGTLPEPLAAYYRGLAALQAKHVEAAKGYLESAVATAQGVYLTRSILALGAVAGYKGEYREEQSFYADALKYKQDYFSYIETLRAIAIYDENKSREQRIEILQCLYPIACKAPGQRLRLDVLNSLAVEFHQARKLQEARKLSEAVCASPLASICSEFRETRAEIEQEIAETQSQATIVVVPVRPAKQPQQKVIIRFLVVESRARRRVIKPTIGRAPVICSIIERVATVAPIHAPPFNQ